MAAPTTFEYTDPRSLDGTCFEVAHAACEQAAKVVAVASEAVGDAFVMARVAEMERQIQAGEEPHGSTFGDEPLGRRILAANAQLEQLVNTLHRLGTAASYNPRNPPKELTDGK